MTDCELTRNVLKAAEEPTAMFNLDQAKHIERLIFALELLTPSHRKPGCWCGFGQNIEQDGHTPACRHARFAIDSVREAKEEK